MSQKILGRYDSIDSIVGYNFKKVGGGRAHFTSHFTSFYCIHIDPNTQSVRFPGLRWLQTMRDSLPNRFPEHSSGVHMDQLGENGRLEDIGLKRCLQIQRVLDGPSRNNL